MSDDKPDEDGKESKASEEHVPEGEVIYRAIRQDGDYALCLTSMELAYSGLAAGLSMGFSLIGEGLLRAHLPEAPWAPLVSKFGYALGFLIVILGRQQLFTEQTLSSILPLLSPDRPHGNLPNVARLWIVVLLANLAGAAGLALVTAWTPAFSGEVQAAFSKIGNEALSHGFGTQFIRGIYAGFLIATMVWLLPGAGHARLWIVVILAYFVGVAGLAHVIAGSSETLYVVFKGEHAFGEYLVGFLVPAFLGNSVGGVALVGALAHAQHAPTE
jgi:formate/nitrite transporter FocA (FNT family)